MLLLSSFLFPARRPRPPSIFLKKQDKIRKTKRGIKGRAKSWGKENGEKGNKGGRGMRRGYRKLFHTWWRRTMVKKKKRWEKQEEQQEDGEGRRKKKRNKKKIKKGKEGRKMQECSSGGGWKLSTSKMRKSLRSSGISLLPSSKLFQRLLG